MSQQGDVDDRRANSVLVTMNELVNQKWGQVLAPLKRGREMSLPLHFLTCRVNGDNDREDIYELLRGVPSTQHPQNKASHHSPKKTK